MALPEGTTSGSLINNLKYRVAHDHHGSQRAPTAGPLRASSAPSSHRDNATKQLTSRIAHILYYDGHQPGDGHTGFRYGDLHKDFEVGPLLAQYEPGAQSDPQQLKVILEHLRPLVKTGEAAVVGLYNFFKTFLALRKTWLKAAGEFYSLLAYVDMCKRWGLHGGGPSFAGTSGSELLQSQLVKTQEHFETTYSGLQTFKSSSAFTQNMRQVFAYYEKMKADEEQRQKRNNEAMMKAKEDEKKRTTIKQRNERVLVRQMGPIDGEMGDALQQHILDMMTDTMQFELGVTGTESEKAH